MQRRTDLEKYREQIASLPNDFDEWAFSQFDEAYNFYKGNLTLSDDIGNDIKLKGAIWCPVCREWTEPEGKFKAGAGYTCKCGSKGVLFYANKKKNPTNEYQTMWYGQQLKNKVFVLRGFVVALVQRSPVECGYEDQYTIYKMEKRRIYIGSSWFGIEYNNYDWNKNERFWACTGSDSTNICGPVHPDTYENVKGTWAEYSCLDIARDEELFYSGPCIRGGYGRGPYEGYQRSIFDYLRTYAKDRRVEMLMKLGLYALVEKKVAGCGDKFNYRAKNPYDYLRIYKTRLESLRGSSDQSGLLRVYQLERQMGKHWSDDEVEIIRINYLHLQTIKEILEYMSLTQFTNRINTYCERERRTARECCSIYFDYFITKKSLGYDMHNTIYQYPKDLWRAHDETMEEEDRRRLEVRLEKAEKNYPKISKRFEKAKDIYSYQNGKLMIRPVMSATEMILEGNRLHHCVGNERVGYLRKCNEGEDIILVLRHTKTPDMPYITVEVGNDGKILQWFGVYDTQPNFKSNEAWLKRYIKQLDVKQVEKEMKKAKRIRA